MIVSFNDDMATHTIETNKISYICQYNDKQNFYIEVVIEGVPKAFMFGFDSENKEQVKSLHGSTWLLILKGMES